MIGRRGSAALVVLVLAIAAPAMAQADSPIHEFTSMPSSGQAGGHPDITVNFRFGNRDTQGFPSPCLCEDPKDITVSLPTGVIGNPHATPQCTRVDFGVSQCSPSTQVGVAGLNLFGMIFPVAVYNLEPNPDEAGVLGMFAPLANAPLFTVLSARTGSDYGLDSTLKGIEHIIPPEGVELTLWGVPADPANDANRAPLGGSPCSDGPYPCFAPRPSNSEPIPFLDNPTSCEGPATSHLEILSYDHGVTQAEATWPETTGCDQLSFNPSLYAQPTSDTSDSASGLDTDLTVPQLVSPTTPSPSEIRALTVTLPEGMSINPNAADGKEACSDAQARIGTEEAAQCPEFSKVGTSSLSSSALPGPISGSVYLGEPKPGERYRLVLTANGFNTHVKLLGTVKPDPMTGQLLISFGHLPQSPFSNFNLHFFGSERGLLATPTQCGTYAVQSTFTPWDGKLSEQSSVQYFNVSSGPSETSCPGPVRPLNLGFGAGVADSTAGVHSPFYVELTRSDGNQFLAGLRVQTPPGFSATLKGIPYCSDASIDAISDAAYSGLSEQAHPTCPAASQIGVSTTGAGAGTHPVYLAGTVYLAGPYKGAPLSLVVVTPAVSGPYDLGNVVVRAALDVDPSTAQITAVSDPLPQILQGIPLRLRSVLVQLNRPGFTLNPTNCEPFAITADVLGDQGTAVKRSAHFQVSNCRDLAYGPHLSLKLTGGVRRRGHPAIHAAFTAKPGEANTKSVSLSLPKSELLDNAHLRTICTRVDFARGSCPAGSLIGAAEVTTPLLDKPLSGNVYLRSNPARELPDLVLDFKGQIDIELAGHIDTAKGGGLRTTFQGVPDAPVSSLTLNLSGGAKGLLINSESLCGKTKSASLTMVGQNGLSRTEKAQLQAGCRSGSSHRRRIGRVKEVG